MDRGFCNNPNCLHCYQKRLQQRQYQQQYFNTGNNYANNVNPQVATPHHDNINHINNVNGLNNTHGVDDFNLNANNFNTPIPNIHTNDEFEIPQESHEQINDKQNNEELVKTINEIVLSGLKVHSDSMNKYFDICFNGLNSQVDKLVEKIDEFDTKFVDTYEKLKVQDERLQEILTKEDKININELKDTLTREIKNELKSNISELSQDIKDIKIKIEEIESAPQEIPMELPRMNAYDTYDTIQPKQYNSDITELSLSTNVNQSVSQPLEESKPQYIVDKGVTKELTKNIFGQETYKKVKV